MLREREAGLSNVIMATVSLRNTVSDYEYIYANCVLLLEKHGRIPIPLRLFAGKPRLNKRLLLFLSSIIFGGRRNN